MKLRDDWRRILKHAWSVRLMVLAALLSGLEVLVSFAGAWLPIPDGALAILAALVTAGAFIARLVVQQRVSGRTHETNPS